MDKNAMVIIGAVMLIALIVSSTPAQAQIVTYLPSFISSLLTGAGIYVISVGAVFIVGGYLVYRVSTSTYSYFRSYAYTTVSDHAWLEHAYDFPNIWGSGVKPSKTTFDNKCKDNMNSKTAQKFIQKYDGRLLSWNPTTKMVSVGDTDGKTVITCFPKSSADVLKKQSTGEWIKVAVK